jgi:virginiamycin B lyase
LFQKFFIPYGQYRTVNPRLFIGALTLCAFCGCAQSNVPLPNGAASPVRSAGRVELPNQGPLVKLFNTPTGGSWPDYIVSGPDRSMWFSEFYIDKIGKVQMNGHMTEFSLPDNTDIEGITIGGDGNIWFTSPGANKIGRMTPQGSVTTFAIPASNPDPRGITLGSDGNVWYVEFYDGYIGRVAPDGTITRFALPEGTQSSPWAIVTGPDGRLWVTESFADKIARFDPNSQTFAPSLTVPTQYATPWGIITAPDKHVWFTERNGNKIAEVTSKGKIKEFSIAQPGSYPETLAPGKDGNLWFTEMQAGKVAAINPKTGKFGTVITLSSGSIPIGIAQGPNKNDWFCISFYNQAMQIGELAF